MEDIEELLGDDGVKASHPFGRSAALSGMATLGAVQARPWDATATAGSAGFTSGHGAGAATKIGFAAAMFFLFFL